MVETKCKRGFQSHVMCDCEPVHPLTPSEKDVQQRVEKIVFEKFYGGPLSGSTERLAAALIAEFNITALASGSGDHAELARLADLLDLYAAAREDEFTVEDVQLIDRGSGLISALLAENAALRAEMVEWRPIETAPRDGTVILGWSSFFPKRRPVEVAWDPDRYARKPVPRWVARDAVYGRRAFIDHPLTHWLPLPPAPGAEDE